jgi:hypothetical protein
MSSKPPCASSYPSQRTACGIALTALVAVLTANPSAAQNQQQSTPAPVRPTPVQRTPQAPPQTRAPAPTQTPSSPFNLFAPSNGANNPSAAARNAPNSALPATTPNARSTNSPAAAPNAANAAAQLQKLFKTPQTNTTNAATNRLPSASVPNTNAGTNRLMQASLNANQRSAASGPPVPSRNFPGHPGPPGSTETQNRNGSIVRTAADGSVIDVRNPRNGVSIHHALDGSRRIMVEQPDHSRVVIPSRGIQYVQHPYVFHGHAMDHRTFVVQGQLFHQFYRPYNYGGTTLDVYATPRYYAPNFYQWATSRFNAPTNYNWGYTTNSTPWFGHYHGFFTPDSSYQTPQTWLADYMLGATLFVAYTAKGEASDPLPENAAPVTPQVKQMLAEEIGRQVKQEAAEAADNAKNREPQPGAGSVVQVLADRQPHVFVVSSDLDLVDPTGRRCSMSEGDVVQVTSGPKPDTGTVDAVVLASKGGVECGRAAQVQVALNDVQEMQNHMRETIDQGLATTPAGKQAQSVTPAFAASAPPADANATREIQQQQEIAAAAEG